MVLPVNSGGYEDMWAEPSLRRVKACAMKDLAHSSPMDEDHDIGMSSEYRIRGQCNGFQG